MSGKTGTCVVGYHDVNSENNGNYPKVIACYNIGEMSHQSEFNISPIAGICGSKSAPVVGCYSSGSITSNTTYGQSYISEYNNTACYFDASDSETSTTYLDGSVVTHPTEIGVDGSTVTWEAAMEAMNAAIKVELGDDTPYVFVLNTNDETKDKEPLILKVDSSN